MEQPTPNNQSSHHGTQTKGASLAKPFLVLVLLVIFAGGGFYGGVSYEKDHEVKPTSVSNASYAGYSGSYGGRFGGGHRPTFGSVTAISPSSISVQDSRTGSTVTLSITSSTTITDNGQTVTTSDIQTGDTVAVIASSSSSTQASRILVNPSYGGGNNPAPSSTSVD